MPDRFWNLVREAAEASDKSYLYGPCDVTPWEEVANILRAELTVTERAVLRLICQEIDLPPEYTDDDNA